jgi:hypothetical protein
VSVDHRRHDVVVNVAMAACQRERPRAYGKQRRR